MIPPNIVQIVRNFRKGAVKTTAGAPESSITEIETRLGRPLPGDLRDLYLYSNGIELLGKAARIRILSLDKLLYFNTQEDYLELMPNCVLFGFNEGEYFLYIDAGNFLKNGPDAVFVCSRGAGTFGASQFGGRNLCEFVMSLKDDTELLARPFVFETNSAISMPD